MLVLSKQLWIRPGVCVRVCARIPSYLLPRVANIAKLTSKERKRFSFSVELSWNLYRYRCILIRLSPPPMLTAAIQEIIPNLLKTETLVILWPLYYSMNMIVCFKYLTTIRILHRDINVVKLRYISQINMKCWTIPVCKHNDVMTIYYSNKSDYESMPLLPTIIHANELYQHNSVFGGEVWRLANKGRDKQELGGV